MRAGSIALILSGLLASTSAVGIVVWNSYQEEVGSQEGETEVDANAEAQAGEAATVAALAELPPTTLQFDEALFDEIPAFELGELRLAAIDPVSPTARPLPIDMSFTHVPTGAEASGSGITTSQAYTTSSSSSGRQLTTFAMRSGGAGGAARKETDAPGAVDEPPPVDEPEQPGDLNESPDESKDEDGGRGPEEPTPPDPDRPGPDHDNPFDPEAGTPVNVPEPGTLGLLMMGAAGLLFGRRRSRAPISR